MKNTQSILMVAGIALVAYYVGTRLFPRKTWTSTAGVPVISGSQQQQHLTDQCGGWGECMAGWGI